MDKIGRPISKPITLRQVNDIAINFYETEMHQKCDCHSKLFLRLTFLSTKFYLRKVETASICGFAFGVQHLFRFAIGALH